ncbi:MAG: PAS domain S-box protein [Anaerolineae bacterium]|nr:PAS domain S-box protein [Anaerolineae bacterium]
MKTIQNRFKQIIASSNAVIYSAELQGSHATTFISDNVKVQLGYEPREFMDDPKFWCGHIHPEDSQHVFNAMNHVPKYGYSSVDYRLQHQDGSYHWFHHDLMCSRDNEGKPTEIVGFWVDITERKQMEQALEDSDAKYREIFEAAHDIILLMDKDCNILEVNHRAEILLGYSKAELLQMNTLQHLSVPEDRVMMQQVNDDLIKGRCRTYTVRWKAKDGSIVHFEAASAPRITSGEAFISTICTLRDITERKGAEDALKRSERRFTTVFDNSPVPTVISRLKDGQIVDINDAFLKLLGYEREALIGYSVSELNLWAFPEKRFDVTKTITEKGHIHTFEMQARTKSGELRYLLESAELIDLGDEAHIVVMLYDITERKQAEDELASLYRATAYLFKAGSLLNLGQQIVEAVVREFAYADCGLLLVDKDANKLVRLARTGEYAVSTDAPLYLDGLGLVPHAVRAGKIVYTPDVSANTDYATNDSRTRCELVVPLQTTKGVLGVLDLQSADLNAFSERDERILVAFAERAAAAIEIMQLYEEVNLSASRLEGQVAQRTMQLQQAKERIETILNNTGDAIVLLNSDGIIQQINRPFSQLFGFISDEIFHQPLQFLVAPNQTETVIHVIQSVTATRVPNRIELVMRDKAGTPFDADVSFAPVMDYDSQTPSIICSIHDMTLRKQAQEDLRYALKKEIELNLLKSSFVSMVSHEFRTPLAVIMTSADLIRRYSDRMSVEKQNEQFDRINSQIYRLTALMEDVLTISKGDITGIKSYPEKLDLEALSRLIVDEIQSSAKENEIQLTVSGDCSQANLDPKLFRQILYNLLSNALKYSPDKGIVRMELSCNPQTAIVRIIDQGIGIPEADQVHLFEVFHRAANVGKIQGTGLGLAIVKQAVEAQKGTITVESKIGAGTIFTVVIPITATKG